MRCKNCGSTNSQLSSFKFCPECRTRYASEKQEDEPATLKAETGIENNNGEDVESEGQPECGTRHANDKQENEPATEKKEAETESNDGEYVKAEEHPGDNSQAEQFWSEREQCGQQPTLDTQGFPHLSDNGIVYLSDADNSQTETENEVSVMDQIPPGASDDLPYISPTLHQVNPQIGVTVVFHVVLISADIEKMDQESFSIRAKEEDLGDFQISCVDMQCTRIEKDRMYARGQFTLSLDRARGGTSYKYVMVKKGAVHWEDLVQLSIPDKTVENRFLKIPDEYVKPNAIWHQFDGVAYLSKSTRWLKPRSDGQIRDLTKALDYFLQKRIGDFSDNDEKKMTATEVVERVKNVIQCLCNPWLEVEGRPQNFEKLNEVAVHRNLLKFLMSKRKEVYNPDKENAGLISPSAEIVLSVVIVVLIEKYNYSIEEKDAISILRGLALEADSTKTRCDTFTTVLDEFSSELRTLAGRGIEKLCNQVMAKSQYQWLFAVPLLHFLRGDFVPFKNPDTKGNTRKPNWWGAQNLEKIKEFQNSSKCDWVKRIPCLESSIEVDLLLRRTMLRAIPVWDLSRIVHLKKFPVSELCAALAEFSLTANMNTEKWKDVECCIELMIDACDRDEACSSRENAEFRECQSLNLVKRYLETLTFQYHIDVICLAIKLLFRCIKKTRGGPINARATEKKEGSVPPLVDNSTGQLFEMLRVGVSSGFNQSGMPVETEDLDRELQVWSKLLKIATEDEIGACYRTFLSEQVTLRANKSNPLYVFIHVDMDNYDRAVKESFTNLALEAVKQITEKGENVEEKLKLNDPESQRRCGDLLSTLLTKSWPKTSEQVATFILGWNSMIGYLKVFGGKSEVRDILTAQARKLLAAAKTTLEALVGVISDASITVELLKQLKAREQRLFELLKANDHDGMEPQVSIEDTRQALHQRIEELEEFSKVKEQVVSFEAMCALLQTVDISSIKKKIPQDVSFHKIRDLCNRQDNGIIKVAFFDLPADVTESLPMLHEVQATCTFQELWRQFGQTVNNDRTNDERQKQLLTMSEVVEQVWKPSFTCWSTVAGSVMDGSITLSDVDKHFDRFKGRKVELEQELHTMLNIHQDHVTEGFKGQQEISQNRADQIERYQQLHQCASAAGTVWKLKETMGFSGDFNVIDDLRSQISESFKQRSLSSIGKQFEEASRELTCLTVAKKECFQAVGESRALVQWLHATLASTQELKLLVDMALILAGESDIETDRISNLHTACLGFAPVIFNLREDEDKKVGFDELLEACDPVWRAVDENPTLSDKLRDANQHLEWFKTIIDYHGSIAMTSLAKAEDINARGVYLVGRLNVDDDSPVGKEKQQSLHNVTRLIVPPKDDGEGVDSITYSLDDLKDLQSKLMLIAAKAFQGKEEVDTFVKNLEGVLRLSTAFVNLCESGYVHQMDWNQEFHCSKDRLADESVFRELAEVSTNMEKCLLDWKQKVSDARKDFPHLNFFTTQQLVFLRKEIARVCHSNDLQVTNLQVLSLLESVCPNVKADHLKTAIQRCFGTSLTDEKRGVVPSFTKPSQNATSKIRKEKEEYTNVLAIEEDTVRGKGDDLQVQRDTSGSDGQSEERPPISDSDMLHELPCASHDTAETIDGSEAKHDKFLTIAQLANILRKLAATEEEKPNPVFPAWLKRGRPNLMLVPKHDVLATVLALYMDDRDKPLPTQDKVLICTPETTTEEIELLLRRAIGHMHGQFYCLVHADQLDFFVSKKAVDMLDMLTQGLAGKQGEDYGLVVICSSENEDRANIVALLDQFRVTTPPCPSLDEVRSYLKHHFQAPCPFESSDKTSWTPAGFLDPEKLSVRVISSSRGGLGKTLVFRRFTDRLPNLKNNDVIEQLQRSGSDIQLHSTVTLHGNSLDLSKVLDSLLPHEVSSGIPLSRIFHLDVSPSVRHGLDTLLFNLLILGSVCDRRGRVWRRRNTDLYIIEVTTSFPLPSWISKEERAERRQAPFYELLPTITCSTPNVAMQKLNASEEPSDLNPLFDEREFRSECFQRVFYYLKLSSEKKSLDVNFEATNIDDDRKTCLNLLLRNCGIQDPSWSEIHHFVSFLNSQLRDCENSVFCDVKLMRKVLAGAAQTLEGFRSFVVKFMIQMSRDFATPSLTEETPFVFTGESKEQEIKEIENFQLRRRWENSPHPYLFFNQDHNTISFFGFFIDHEGDLVDPKTKRVLAKKIMAPPLQASLAVQKVDFKINTDDMSKDDKISQLCSVMGVQWEHDPDRFYELTADNVKKILAIHTRLRCNIPVIVMGETGCGKTRLIRYMCGLQSGSGGPRNMILVKVHGGTTCEEIEQKVCQAEEMARQNQDKDIDTVLFFDEANTTEALSVIKEVIVDRRIGGRPIGVGLQRLRFIVACNPYRRHTDEMIHKLESAGLGYRIKTVESDDRLGHIPLRHLVYRVHALPGSMRPLIWDFGQLKPEVEELYIRQIVYRYIIRERKIAGDEATVKAFTSVLVTSQKFMREQSDECSFVSLRDVERVMQVVVWFLDRGVEKVVSGNQQTGNGDARENENKVKPLDPITRALVIAIGVCYHAKLQGRREEYRTAAAGSFKPPCALPGGQKQILREITSCQQAVLNELDLGPNIARNTALSENVFMMVVCIELRIPLFVVGKPGSSKSLAKTVVADNMQGIASKSDLLKTFKEVHMTSYQCSPLSTPESIEATFRQCSKLQEGKNSDKFASVVVLDEVGLAEDSPQMPLKTLHSLLDDGMKTSDNFIETDEIPQRLAFIGISNWALDPAKMNRGIMLSHGVPDEHELVCSALGICATDLRLQDVIRPLIPPLAKGYAHVYKEQKNFEALTKYGKEEFFGLRDFYNLIKMVYAMAAKSEQRPRWHQIEHAIKRNFGGLTEGKSVDIFKRYFGVDEDEEAVDDSTTMTLIGSSLRKENVADRKNFSENRYLLVLTENYAALRIMQQHLQSTVQSKGDAVVIFGSSFPNDQEYTQICRNINRIKVCMETGRTVILLNLESLYESLYDALNQYYEFLGEQKYVDLGLGRHRVKCRVHNDFKLIVIAEKDVVYQTFPIPLINRLEKHFVVTASILTKDQIALVEKVRVWAQQFAEIPSWECRSRTFTIEDAFVGYHEDTIPSIVMQVCNEIGEEVLSADEIPDDTLQAKVFKRSQKLLIEIAPPDAIARLPSTALKSSAQETWNIYFHQQQHSSLAAYMTHVLTARQRDSGLFVQVMSHSRLLSAVDLDDICKATKFHRSTIECMTLQYFQTEQQFRDSVRIFCGHLGGDSGILIVQCASQEDNFNLIAGARHILMQEIGNAPEMLHLPEMEPIHVVLVMQLPKIGGGCRNVFGFQGGKWLSVHIDELRPPGKHTLPIEHLVDRPISELFRAENNEQQLENAAMLKEQANALEVLCNCVQAATCRIDDKPESAERSTHRIKLLLDLLSAKGTFVAVLIRRMYQLLKERDDAIYRPNGWIHSEAMSGTGVLECGSFRKALSQRVDSAVVPILAEIVAFADSNDNLDLMIKDNSWISTLWLKILDNGIVSELHYSSMISPVSNTVRTRVPIHGSGAGGHGFICRFPFSWLIKKHVDEMLKFASNDAGQSKTAVVESLRNFIDNSAIGPLLSEITNEHVAPLEYLMDFAHMVYKPSDAATETIEHKLVYEAILSSARELGAKEDDAGNDLIDIPLVHVAYSRIQSRLRSFALLVKVQPNVLQRLTSIFRGKYCETMLDAVALQIALEALYPSDYQREWCDCVLAIRPAVEDMLGKNRFGPSTELSSTYGDMTRTKLNQCRSMWQRAVAVRLFLEHVTMFEEHGDGEYSEQAVKLWKALGSDTDFSSLRSLQVIVRFLTNCENERSEKDDTATKYHERYNAFFVELVSIFCFGETESRSVKPDALSMLMSYAIGHESAQTQDVSSISDSGIDPIPVVRSFLLQQLLCSNADMVKQHMVDFLQRTQLLNMAPHHIRDVCFLYVHCMEAALISCHKERIPDSGLALKIRHAREQCDESFRSLNAVHELSADALEGVAKGRYVLTLLAECLHKRFIEEDRNWRDLEVLDEMTSFLKSAKRLCLETGSDMPQLYLLQQLAKGFGLDCIRTLVGLEKLQWILPGDQQKEKGIFYDRFVVYGNSYCDLRKGVAEAGVSGKVQDITTAITANEATDVQKEVLLLVALYREVTLTNVRQQAISDETMRMFHDFVQNGGHISKAAQPLANQLLETHRGGQLRQLQIFPEMRPSQHTIAEIIIHCSVALQCVGTGSLVEPLYLVMENPTVMKNSYLPTMPEDSLPEHIKTAITSAEGRGEFYKCDNCGQPYFIGECKRPMQIGHCVNCGSVVGGEEHKFYGGSRECRTGHVLGRPASRSTDADSQRSMSPIMCGIIRIIMHSAMLMGACRNPQAIAEMITPAIEPDEVAGFLLQHLQRDFDVLGKGLGRSVDDAALVVHLVLQRLVSLRGGQSDERYDMRLNDGESRLGWEKDFNSVFIAPVFKNFDEILQKAVSLLMEDERFRSELLVQKLLELNEEAEELSEGLHPFSWVLWRYRQEVSIKHLTQCFQQKALSDSSEQYKVLSAFLKEEPKLRAVTFLPDLIRLQRLLMDKFHRRINRADAETITVTNFLRELPRGTEKDVYENLFQSFMNAWNMCRTFLGDNGRFKVCEEFCNIAVERDCPIAILLPSASGVGLCSLSLTSFLVKTHNELLKTYLCATNQENSLDRISVLEVAASHLIAYDTERDLLPLILANCNYSLDAGRNTLVQYNWESLERSLIDRLLRGKSYVEFKEETFAFSEDTRDERVITSLRDKIPQKPISRAIEDQIVAEFRSSLADVCDVLSSLDIAIGFLASSGGIPDMQLTHYLHAVLRLPKDRGLKSQTAEKHCTLCNTLALWWLMALEKAKIMSRNKQEPFENLPDVFKEKLSLPVTAKLNRVLRRIDMNVFLPFLLKMILFEVKHDGEATATMSFKDYLDLKQEKDLDTISGAENIPDDVCVSHLKAVWNSAVKLCDDYYK